MSNQASPKRLTRRSFLQQSGVAAGAASTSASAVSGAAAAAPGPRPDGKKVRIGVVGGRFGATFQWHLQPDCEVSAVCDIRADRLQTLGEVYRTDNTYDDFRKFLKHPELDAVGVFTPAPLHAWMATEAMEAGKHVISAVPAGLSVEELERLIETVNKTGMKYMMAETTYYRPQIITCRQWAKEGKFGEIFYSESEYHHNLPQLKYDERGLPTWRHGFPPMWYITHQTGAIVPVSGERLSEVQAIGWGDGHEVLRTNRYQNPFWNTNGFFKTSNGHCCRISVFWRSAAGFAQRSQFYGERFSYVMGRGPENHPDTVMRLDHTGPNAYDGKGYPVAKVIAQPAGDAQEKHWHLLPKELHVKTGHAGSHAHISQEFIRAIVEDRHPEVDVWEAVAYTMPGIMAHESALRDGEPTKIKDYGRRPG